MATISKLTLMARERQKLSQSEIYLLQQIPTNNQKLMLSALLRQFQPALILQLMVLSGLLLSIPVKAEHPSNLLLTQLPMPQNQPLPPLPINQDPYTVPLVNNGTGQVFEFQAPPQNPQYQQAPMPQYNQTYERYSVVVDTNGYSGQLLQQVKQVEPSAYIRNINGRSVIQAGVFTRQQNAVLRIQQLLATGINFYNVRLFNAVNWQEIAITPDEGGIGGSIGNYPNDVNQNNSSYYYVAIPTRPEDFTQIEQTVWRSLGQYANNIGVQRRNQPRGAHIAVGPFTQRGQAEQWNAVLKNAGLGNARVYYGR
ncbi:hypothetical protein CAL7716_086150 [Calothrix sp. PCC 7716]|nr:hypothetical protein CAL7716_086150 [Calothrix sp. PCC 7716]